MRDDSVRIEDARIKGLDLDNYPWVHERHRIFPEVFGSEGYQNILDIAAGVGVVAKRIHDLYPCKMLCNDISKECLRCLKANNLSTVSFDLDDPGTPFPFPDETFDAIISLATLEHIINIDHHMREVRRILKKDGHLYLSTPNYSGIHFVVPFLLHGKSFHDPMKGGIDTYEFYAHVRYFTYKTLLEFTSSFGFRAEKVYLPIPKESSRYRALEKKSRIRALLAKTVIYLLYRLLPSRWAFHPVIRFAKHDGLADGEAFKLEKIII